MPQFMNYGIADERVWSSDSAGGSLPLTPRCSRLGRQMSLSKISSFTITESHKNKNRWDLSFSTISNFSISKELETPNELVPASRMELGISRISSGSLKKSLKGRLFV